MKVSIETYPNGLHISKMLPVNGNIFHSTEVTIVVVTREYVVICKNCNIKAVTNVRMATILQFLQITERDLSLYKTPSQNLIYKYINLFFCLLHVRPSSLSSVRTVRLTMKVIILKSFNF